MFEEVDEFGRGSLEGKQIYLSQLGQVIGNAFRLTYFNVVPPQPGSPENPSNDARDFQSDFLAFRELIDPAEDETLQGIRQIEILELLTVFRIEIIILNLCMVNVLCLDPYPPASPVQGEVMVESFWRSSDVPSCLTFRAVGLVR